ncbi:MAG: WYL domain-containing protein [Burkholderiales bacterium]|nr:WYL domain-containing protein [Burkholderiales bacterium]
MARTTSNLTEAINLLEIIRRIPFHPKKITSSDLFQALEAKKIKMSLRTLQRALDALQKSELGIECDKSSKPYGYSRLPQVQELDSFKLDDETSLLLRLAQEHLKYQMPARMIGSLDYLFSQSKEEDKEPRSHQWLKKVAVVSGVIPQVAPDIKPRIFNAVTEGLLHEKQLQIEYVNSKRQRSNMTVLPLGLVQQESRLYLVCMPVDDMTKVESKALHRMQSVKVTDLSFIPPADFSLKKYLSSGSFNYDYPGRGQPIRLSFLFSNDITAVNLQETPFNKTQKIRKLTNGKNKGKYRLTVDIEDTFLLDAWIKTWTEMAGIENVKKKPLTKEAEIVSASIR